MIQRPELNSINILDKCRRCIYVKVVIAENKYRWNCRIDCHDFNKFKKNEIWDIMPYNIPDNGYLQSLKTNDDTEEKRKQVKKRMDNEKLNEVDIETGEIELPKLNLEPYIGKKVKIADVKTMEGKYGYVVKVSTEKLDDLTLANGEKKPLCASRLYGLHKDESGNVGWGDKTKLGIFMAKMKCKTLKSLVGKEVIVIIQSNKDGQEFLSI